MLDIKQQIINKAKELQIDKIGFAKAGYLPKEKEVSIEAYSKGYFADKKYLYDNLELKYDLSKLLPEAKTVIATAVNYYTPCKHTEPVGKISRHAWGRDYHNLLRSKIKQISQFIEENFNAQNFISIDGGKVFEKVWAERCGIGWQGKHSIIITPEFGSWVFLGIIITSLEIEPDIPHKDLCGTCRKCIDTCPNAAIAADKTIDLRKCIAYLNIEQKINDSTPNSNFEGYIYGCDICQEACPYNRHPQSTLISDFYPINGETNLHPEKIMNFSKDEFNIRFAESSIKRVGLNKMKSNAVNLISSAKK